MRFVCDSCRAQYMISDDKVGAKGVKVRCKKCGYVILVRRADAAAAAPAPAPEAPPAPQESASAEGGEASGESDAGQGASPGLTNGANGSHSDSPLGGVLDDEIGAVFDQVLKSGPHKIEEKPAINSLAPPPEKESLDLGMDDDLASTRAVSTDALKKLVAEAEAVANGGSVSRTPAPPPNDWYVAIDEQQQGPLTFDQVRDLWDRGELGADSLCWRAGMGDWIPLSEVTELASALAPKPQKPVVVAPATSQVGTVVSVPTEGSVNVGGMARASGSHTAFAVPSMAAASDSPAADTGGWKPSAASALAALVSEEMTALSSKPKASGRSLLESGPSERPNFSALDSVPAPKPAGLFDIPSAPGDIPNGKGLFPQAPASDAPVLTASAPAAALTQSPQQPYAGPSVYGATPYPAYTPAPPPSVGMSRGLKIGLGVGGGVVVALVAVVVMLLSREPAAPAMAEAPVEKPVEKPVVAAAPPPAAPTPAAALPMPPPPPGTVEKPAEATAQATPPPAEKPAPVAATPAKPEPVAVAAKPDPTPAPSARTTRRTGTTTAAGADSDDGDAIVARSTKSTTPPPTSGTGDDFDKLFGDEEKPAAKPSGSTKPKRQPGYIPPPPGGGDVQESLGQSDIMQVVLANKGDIVKCVNEMKAKEPGISGKLVMRWTILTSGKTSSVSVRTAEFKDTHMARCMTGLVRGWTFPRHKVAGGPIDFPFTF